MNSATTDPPDPAAVAPPAGHIVGRNMLALVIAQFITTPVSLVVNAALARKLGASDFGAIYFATTALGVWFLFVEWGGHAQVAAAVARDRAAAARLLISGLVLRTTFAVIVAALMQPFGRWMGYDETIQIALGLVAIRLALQSIGALALAVIRGFEKVHWQAGATVFGSVLEATFVLATVLQGGGLREALMAQVAAAAITLGAQLTLVARLGLVPTRPDWSTSQSILFGGFSFLLLDLVVRLQPYIDATFLQHLAPPETLGWYSAASRIAGVLLFPAYTLNSALYPTLVRLWQTDRHTYDSLVRLGLRSVIILGALAATGAFLFSPVVVNLVYGQERYGPAATNLAVMAIYIALVYSTVVLGPSIAAAGRQWPWCAAQSLCLVISMILDPILIPWAQARYGNGGLGVCLAIVVAEVAMITAGLFILPRGAVNRRLGLTLARCLTAAIGMGVVGMLLRHLPILAMPASALTYLALVWKMGELDADLLALAPPWLVDRVNAITPGLQQRAG
ncbi:MAG: oligosaccharide flippase family protein [Acidobacteria bacterium]|nr:oligosaccharide flippase family protein [Acidobacteriota bacterium]